MNPRGYFALVGALVAVACWAWNARRTPMHEPLRRVTL